MARSSGDPQRHRRAVVHPWMPSTEAGRPWRSDPADTWMDGWMDGAETLAPHPPIPLDGWMDGGDHLLSLGVGVVALDAGDGLQHLHAGQRPSPSPSPLNKLLPACEEAIAITMEQERSFPLSLSLCLCVFVPWSGPDFNMLGGHTILCFATLVSCGV